MFYRRLMGLPTLRFSSPFSELEKMRRQMDSLFQQYAEGAAPGAPAGVFPAINLTEDKNSYYIRAELPGVQSADLDIQATGTTLSISGERRIPSEDPGVRYHRREREAGRFSRIIGLPGDVDPQTVNAKLVNGMLTVTVPKAEKAKPRQITVK
jgi:HSP20 family protein